MSYSSSSTRRSSAVNTRAPFRGSSVHGRTVPVVAAPPAALALTLGCTRAPETADGGGMGSAPCRTIGWRCGCGRSGCSIFAAAGTAIDTGTDDVEVTGAGADTGDGAGAGATGTERVGVGAGVSAGAGIGTGTATGADTDVVGTDVGRGGVYAGVRELTTGVIGVIGGSGWGRESGVLSLGL